MVAALATVLDQSLSADVCVTLKIEASMHPLKQGGRVLVDTVNVASKRNSKHI